MAPKKMPLFDRRDLHVLLIEDSLEDVYLLKRMLQDKTCIKIVEAEDLSCGIALLQKERFDVVLLDLSLPDSSGLDGLVKLKKENDTTPIIILSSFTDEQIAIEAVQEGAQDYLVKAEITESLIVRSMFYAIERMDIQKRLLASEAQATLLIEKNTAGILLVDQSGLIQFANAEAEKLFERTSEDLIGSAFEYSLSENEPCQIEIPGKKGGVKIVVMTATVVDMEEESFHLASLQDITDRKNAELKLAEQNQELIILNKKLETAKKDLKKKALDLQEDNIFKSQILANMSHELRSPLNSVILLSESLYENQEENLNQEQVKFAKIINKSGKDLLELINSILDFSKIEAGEMPVYVANIYIHDLVESIEFAYQSIAQKKGIQFKISTRGQLPEYIKTDRQKLEQIIRNFVSNALKFTKEGRITIVIERPASVTDHKLNIALDPQQSIAISVLDTGIGILKKDQKSVFQAFRQVDNSSTREYGGTGLGLSISQQLAVLLNGQIFMESTPEKGSCFTLILPEKIELTASITKDRRNEPRRGIKPNDPAAISQDLARKLSGCKLLVVDDDMRNLFGLTKLLEKNNIIVEKAQSGIKALEIIQAIPDIDLILMDIKMPQMDGHETIERIRSLKGKSDIPVIAVTAESLDQYKKGTRSAGADEFASKPVQINDLLYKIGRLVKQE